MIKEQSPISYYLPNDVALNRVEMVMTTVAWEIADKVYNCYGRAEHMVEFAQGILSDPSPYSSNGQAIHAELIKEEIKNVKKT